MTNQNSKHLFILLFLIIIILSAILRFYDLDLRPLHHDEGHNAMWDLIIKEGIPASFEPSGRHGLFPHILNTLAFYLWGDSDFSVRFFASLWGVGLLALLFFFRRVLSNEGGLGSAVILSLSPLMVYFSRFAINEIFLVFFNLVLALSLYLWTVEGNKNFFLTATAAWALMVATKETWVINLATLGGALIITYYLHRRELPPIKTNLRLNIKILAAGVIMSLLLIIVIYTFFFTKLKNLAILYYCHSFWVHQGLSGGDHAYPFLTFTQNLFLWELPFLLLGGISILLWLKFRDTLGTYLFFWTFLTWLAYSLIPYKTPWLIINILLPLGLLGGRSLFYLGKFSLISGKKLKLMVAFLLLSCICLSLWRTVELNFYRFDDPGNWVVRAQEPRHIRKLYRRIYQVTRAQDNFKEVKIDIFLGFYEKSPTLWYLRRYPGKILYDDKKELSRASLVLFSESTKSRLINEIKSEDYEKGRMNSYPGLVYHLWVKKEAWERFKQKDQGTKK